MEWRSIDGVQVSDEGWVKRYEMPEPWLPFIGPGGWRRIRIGCKTVKVHNLVARAFIGEPPTPAHTVDHINQNRADNRVCNLRWATKREQISNRKEIDKIGHMLNNALEYRKIGTAEWLPCPSQQEASRRLGLDQASISRCVARKQKTCCGYEFQAAAVVEIPGEEWREFDGVGVSNMGRARHSSCPPYTPRAAHGMDYAMVKNHLFHRMVAIAFIGPPPFPDAQVDHINRNKSDNRLVNLRWAGRLAQAKNKTPQAYNPTRFKPVKALIAKKWQVFPSAMDAYRVLGRGCSGQNISRSIRQGVKAGGYLWKYAQRTVH